MDKKPTFFISSTIYDFRDLRSAIKFYLEEQGCVVLASEFNDFGQPLDVHSYEACLTQIKAADYFVLLIGSRIGGWFDQTEKISITRHEYRTAYELHLQGRLKLISFVRSDVWAVKDDRKELGKFLDSLEIDPANVKAIKSRPSKASSDAEVLIEFIEEVGRNKQTSDAAQAKTVEFPTGNWIHVVSSFRDVIDVLRGQVFAGRPIDQAIGRQLLRNELLNITASMLTKHKDGAAFFPFNSIKNFANSYPLRSEDLLKSITIKRPDFEKMFVVLMPLSRLRLHVNVIDKILSSDVLLKFDPNSGTFQESESYQALMILRNEVRSFMRNQEGSSLIGLMSKSLSNTGVGQPVTIKIADLLIIRSVADRSFNIVSLATALVRHMSGSSFEMPQLRPKTPFVDQIEGLEAERVSMEDALRFMTK
jgi:hypothetical protein